MGAWQALLPRLDEVLLGLEGAWEGLGSPGGRELARPGQARQASPTDNGPRVRHECGCGTLQAQRTGTAEPRAGRSADATPHAGNRRHLRPPLPLRGPRASSACSLAWKSPDLNRRGADGRARTRATEQALALNEHTAVSSLPRSLPPHPHCRGAALVFSGSRGGEQVGKQGC